MAAEQTLGMELDPKYDQYDYPTTAPEVKAGHPGHLTSQQQAQVHQLRLMLEAEGYTQRLDTITLVCLSYCPYHSVRERILTGGGVCSCGSCAPASSTSTCPRRCESRHCETWTAGRIDGWRLTHAPPSV